MKKILVLIAVVLSACSDNEMKQLGAISYAYTDLKCETSEEVYWLMHIEAKTDKDSVLFNSRTLGRMLELHSASIDSNSSFYELLSRLCTGDSVYLEMNTDSFYLAMNGQTPVDVSRQLRLNISLKDKLNPLQYQVHKQMFEKQSIEKYVKKFRWNASYDSTSGIYFEKLKTARSRNGGFTKAKMRYLIKTIDDKIVAYSKEDEPLIFDKNDDGLLRGLKFVGSQLNDKESIRAIIPSTMAFGAQGHERIPPNHPIIVEMELLEIIE